jgi:hypothetical protein
MAEMNVTSMNQSWRDLYIAALFEPNRSKIPTRIADAEKRIAARARELFNSGDHDILERSALNVAMDALAALRSSLDSNIREGQSSSQSAVA